VRSASRQRTLPRLAVVGCAGALLLGTAAGCQTTQEKAAEHQAEAQRILDARAERQAQKQAAKRKSSGDKPNSGNQNGGKQQ
jgi:Flp pilus assembly protein TadB